MSSIPPAAPSPLLRISLLGGFEVWHGGEPVRGFESQKVRALFAYLVLHRGLAQRRDHLASVFWGDRDEETARRNLRQAVYNLKATLPDEESARPHLLIDGQDVRFNRRSDYWLDVEAFEKAAGRENRRGDGGFRDLVGAVQLYHGDLLAGFALKDCPEFEEWLVTSQERLREEALDALRTLVVGYLERGEFRLGIRHARRLVGMDPLSEAAHRDLMRLYDLAGQRGQALSHYAGLRDLLRRELGVEPQAATRAVHERILGDAIQAEGEAVASPDPLGPVVPLVGRESAYTRLADCWRSVLDGSSQVTLLTGEDGIGKSRLARSFLGEVAPRQRATVLSGTAFEQFPQTSWSPLTEALRQAIADDPDGPAVLAQIPKATRTDLAYLLPELVEPSGRSPTPPVEQLAEAVGALLQAVARRLEPTDTGGPAILFLDDLHLADLGTLALLEALPRWVSGSRVWILGTFVSTRIPTDHPLDRLARRDGDGVVTRIVLDRLPGDAIEEIASSLVDPSEVNALTQLLLKASAGLPLALVALINAMWDEGELVASGQRGWRFTGSPPTWEAPAREGLDRVLLRRVRRLPTSTRRLASMAAVIGSRFDTDLLQRAEDENESVVEVGLGILVERWLVRQRREHWNAAGLERSQAIWRRGGRRGQYLFEHPRIRRVLYDELNPIRRQALHRQVAESLEALHRANPSEVAEALAYHYQQAGVWDRAYSWLVRAAERADAAADPLDAEACRGQARTVLDRLLHQADTEEERERWRSEAARLGPPTLAADR